MCWTDLIARDAKGAYNRKAAKLFGLEAAVYIEELLDIAVQVVRKSTYDKESGFFRLDRAYVTDRTTVSESDQYVIDVMLQENGVLEVDVLDRNMMRINAGQLVNIITGNTPVSVSEIKKPKKKDQAEAKKQGMIKSFVTYVHSKELDPTLVAELDSWIEVCVKEKRLTKKMVDDFIAGLTSWSSDVNRQIEQVKRHAAKAYNMFYKPDGKFTSVSAASPTVSDQTRIATADDIGTVKF